VIYYTIEMNSSTEWMEPVSVDLSDNLTLYSMPSPGSGVLVAYVMNLLDGRLPEKRDLPASLDPLTYHRITEAFKHAFAQRTKLGDPKFVPEVDHVSFLKILNLKKKFN
jgi:gamma-glutamyltranspeptidase/glutathione hydrolase/leukotriene-C4 hydrolase